MPVNQMNEPQLSAEMEARLETILSSSIEMGVGPRKEKMLKSLLTTALEEQKTGYIEQIEAMRIKYRNSGEDNEREIALDDVIALLTQKKEK